LLIDGFQLPSRGSSTFPLTNPLKNILETAAGSRGQESATCFIPTNRITERSAGFLIESLKGISSACLGDLVGYLAASDFVMHISIDSRPRVSSIGSQRYFMSNPSASDQYPRFSSKEALNSAFTLTGRGEIIGLADTGLDDSSCFLSDMSVGSINSNTPRDGELHAEREKVVQYIPFADGVDDVAGHGTHIAGIFNGRAVDMFSAGQGLAVDAKISFFDIGRSGSPHLHLPASISDIFSPAYSSGARVHADSWSCDGNLYSMLSQEVDSFTSQSPDFLVILSAGNAGAHGKYTISNPATSKNAIAVGATQTKNSLSDSPIDRSTLAFFSSMGPTSDGRLKPDIVAPGYSVLSARASEAKNTCALQELSGTSTSVPVVAAAATMLREYFSTASYWAASCDMVRVNILY